MKRDESKQLYRTGAFVILTLGLLLAAVLVLGRSQALFVRRARLHTSFDNTSGLVVGAPVRLAGIDVGVVESLRFERDLHEKRVQVTMTVDRRYLDRIRSDSVARLTSKGLLGDTLVNLTVGSVESTPLRDGATVHGQETEGLTEVVSALHDGVGQLRSLSQSAQGRIEAVLTDDLGRDLGRLAHASADVAENIQRGDGLAHRLVYEPRMGRNADRLLADAAHAATRADGAVARMDRLLEQVEHGPGTLHGLVYRDDGGKLLAELDRGAAALEEFLAQLRNGDGLLHQMVYDDHGELIANLTSASRTLRSLAEEVQQGKGTVGALLQDPSLFEDLKVTFGNIKRSRLLRAIIRMAIRSDGLGASKAPEKK